MSTTSEPEPFVLSIEQQAELAPILGAYLKHANETLAQVKEVLHQGRHAQVARRALRLIEGRERESVVFPSPDNALVPDERTEK